MFSRQYPLINPSCYYIKTAPKCPSRLTSTSIDVGHSACRRTYKRGGTPPPVRDRTDRQQVCGPPRARRASSSSIVNIGTAYDVRNRYGPEDTQQILLSAYIPFQHREKSPILLLPAAARSLKRRQQAECGGVFGEKLESEEIVLFVVVVRRPVRERAHLVAKGRPDATPDVPQAPIRRRPLPWTVNNPPAASSPPQKRKSPPEGVKGKQVRPSRRRPSPPLSLLVSSCRGKLVRMPRRRTTMQTRRCRKSRHRTLRSERKVSNYRRTAPQTDSNVLATRHHAQPYLRRPHLHVALISK
ncbi:hypothetical protein Trydic_g21507 [Trypoxylus dichotomus]